MSPKAERIVGRVAMYAGAVVLVASVMLPWQLGACVAIFLCVGGWGLFTAERARPPALREWDA